MAKKSAQIVIPEDVILHKIYLLRDEKVMLDSDLAELYQVETKRLKEQVKRNKERFPENYMFELTETELGILRSQNATSNEKRGGNRYLPMVFTEHGVLQLSNVLKSQRAVEVSFKIIDVFVKLRQTLTDNVKLRLAIEELRKKTENNSKNIEVVFQYLDELIEKKETQPTRKAIGYKLPAKQKR